jgi:hypothetical protein
MALFRFEFTGVGWRNTAVVRKRPEIVETQNLASLQGYERILSVAIRRGQNKSQIAPYATFFLKFGVVLEKCGIFL